MLDTSYLCTSEFSCWPLESIKNVKNLGHGENLMAAQYKLLDETHHATALHITFDPSKVEQVIKVLVLNTLGFVNVVIKSQTINTVVVCKQY